MSPCLLNDSCWTWIEQNGHGQLHSPPTFSALGIYTELPCRIPATILRPSNTAPRVQCAWVVMPSMAPWTLKLKSWNLQWTFQLQKPIVQSILSCLNFKITSYIHVVLYKIQLPWLGTVNEHKLHNWTHPIQSTACLKVWWVGWLEVTKKIPLSPLSPLESEPLSSPLPRRSYPLSSPGHRIPNQSNSIWSIYIYISIWHSY